MPGTKLTEQELRQWYAKFSQELLEKASIDVNRIEDVGRIKNYAIEEWGTLDNPEDYERAKVGHPTYAFMPHEGTKCLVERPEYVTIDEHMKWLENNLKTELSIDDIRNLYNMSRAGTLMINAPGKSPKFMQQVYTDETGNITTSKPVEEYSTHEVAQNHAKGFSWCGIPQFVPIPDPAQYERPQKPEAPKEPKNMKPGWLSWLGWKLGIKDTDYGKLMEYNAAYKRYEQRLTAWNAIDDAQLTKDYQAAHDRRTQFENEMKELRTRNLVILHGVNGGYNTYALEKMFADQEAETYIEPDKRYNTVMNQENPRMKDWHDKTPLGQLGNALQKVQKHRDDVAKRTLKAVKCLMSFEFSENGLDQWLMNGVFKRGEFPPKDKNDPRSPEPPSVRKPGEKPSLDELRVKLNALSPEKLEERKMWQADMNVLAGLAGFCALGETAKENFSDLVASFFTEGRANSSDKIPYIKPARLKGTQAVIAYADGDATKIGKLFNTGLRMLNQEVKNFKSLQDQHTLGCMFLIDKLMKTAEEKTDIKDKLDLTEQELEEVKVNRALFKAVYQGREARASLMEYAIHQKQMTKEELEQTALDILFEHYVTQMTLDGTKPDFTNPEVVEKVRADLASRNDLGKLADMKPEEVGIMAQSMVNFVKGLSSQTGLVVKAKQVQDNQLVNEHEEHQVKAKEYNPDARNNELQMQNQQEMQQQK